MQTKAEHIAAVEQLIAQRQEERSDYWGEAFEDVVAAALIAFFETKLHKNRGAPPADRMTPEQFAMLRSIGPYVVSPSRIFQAVLDPERDWLFDVDNDPLPKQGLTGHRAEGRIFETFPDAYFAAHYIRQAPALGRYWNKRRGGTLYEMLQLAATKDGVEGERRYFTVTSRGEVASCVQRVSSAHYNAGHPAGVIETDAPVLHETSVWGSMTLQALADRRFCWSITAREKGALAHVGCMREEIKSLLYARSLPMSATGRKRPILHLVAAHQRRMAAGTDVDVTAFLRGTQIVEFGGTVFTVKPPPTLRPEVSKNSGRYFEPTP